MKDIKLKVKEFKNRVAYFNIFEDVKIFVCKNNSTADMFLKGKKLPRKDSLEHALEELKLFGLNVINNTNKCKNT